MLAPDDAADLIQESPKRDREYLLELLDDTTRQDTRALLAYREDVAGGLMNPRFARLRPNASIDEAAGKKIQVNLCEPCRMLEEDNGDVIRFREP